jgi:xanthine dehydrogenase small subunit
MSAPLTFRLNGAPVHAETPSEMLLVYLRGRGLTGTKEGCAEGDCGACTVALRTTVGFEAVNSCLLPVGAVAGRDVVTVEGLARNGTLHPVQEALATAGGSQCGFCTPGFVMSLFAAFYGGERSDDVLEGNLCRCTGYVPIRAALRSLPAPDPDDPFLTPPAPLPVATAVAGFFAPTTLAEVFALLKEHPEAKLLAGGTDVGVEINKLGRVYPVLVSLSGVAELQGLRDTGGVVEIGAGVTLSRLQRELRGTFPALDDMLHRFAARQIRNRATVGGNLGTASPVGDLAPVFLALNAQLKLVSAAGERTLPLSDFFTGYRATALRPGELIAAVRLPKAPPAMTRAYKVSKRGADDISTVSAAFAVALSAAGHVETARLAYGGVAATPARALAVERALVGQPWTAATVREAAAALHAAFTPLSDLRGSAAYRARLVGNLFERFFYETSVPEGEGV